MSVVPVVAGDEPPLAPDSDSLLEEQAAVLEMVVRGDPLPRVLAALCRIAELHTRRPTRAAILLTDEGGGLLRTGAAPSLPDDVIRALDGIAVDPDVGTCGAAAARNEVVVTPAIAADSRWQSLRSLPLAFGLQAAWSMPIVSAAGRVIGTFGTYFFEKTTPLAGERRLVAVLARTAGLAIERSHAGQTLGAAARRDRFLAELAAATQPLIEPAAIMATTAARLAEHLDVTRCAYAEVEDERIFVITGDHPRGVASIVGRWPVAAFGPGCERRMLANQPFVVNDVDAHPEIGPEHRPAYEATAIRAVICVPLHKDGKLTAAMAVHQSTARTWTPEEVELVALVVGRCWEALERARVTRELLESEGRHRAIVEASPECVMVIAGDGVLLQMNRAGLELIEAPAPGAVIGRSVHDLVAPEHRAMFRAFNEKVCRGEAGALTFDLISVRGTRRCMETAAVPLPAPSGGFVHLAVTRDVTARVEADRALAESRSRLDYAARLSGLGFWYCDLPFDELIWDARCRQHFFIEGDTRVTLDLFYERIHPDDRQPTRQAIEASIAERGPYDVVYRTVDPVSGAVKWIRALGGTAYDDAGAPRRFDGVTLDVTEQKVSDQRKDEFIATLAHELRNPLAPIRTGLHLLANTADPKLAARTRVVMERQLGHLVRMIDDLLDISRITLGKLTLKKERIDFRATLRSALETIDPLVREGGHELVVDVPEGALPLDVDPTRLTQVLANLLNNAVKYTSAAGRIVLSAEVDAGELVVRVADTGVGIAPEMVSRVFDMFTQLGPSADRSGGLGIGLTLVRRLVAMHAGSVSAHSDGLGHGSTFTVRLPLAAGADSESVGAGPPDAGAVATPEALRVLIVDDNVDAAECMALLIADRGHQTRVAYDGPNGLATALAFQPHVVFLDIGLSGLNGYEIARQLRNVSAGARPFIVAVTGWGGAEERRRGQEAGFDEHLVKPVEPGRVLAILEDTAERAR